MNEAYVTGRSPERALTSLREIILMDETEPIIDMYERAAWMSGASQQQSTEVIKAARADKQELAALQPSIARLTKAGNESHVRLCSEVRMFGMLNRILDESK